MTFSITITALPMITPVGSSAPGSIIPTCSANSITHSGNAYVGMTILSAVLIDHRPQTTDNFRLDA